MKNEKAVEVVTDLIGKKLSKLLFAALDDASLAIYEKRALKHPRRAMASEKMTDKKRIAIIKDYQTTDMTQAQIAAKHKVNSGRVAETLSLIAPRQPKATKP